MATYYGYAERDASSQVNWAEIGKNMTDMLQEQNRIREEKKAAIDEASRKFGETLANAPTGQNDGLNGFALTHANEASKFRLMQDRLLKSGMLDIKAYTIGRQNLVDGTTKAFDMAKNLQTIYADKREKYDKGELSAADVQLMGMIEGFGKLDDTRTYINPTNGTVSIAKMVKNPDGSISMTENPNGYMSINEMQVFMQKDIGKYKMDEALEQQVKITGGEINAYIKDPGVQRTGSITSISDPTTKANFNKYLNDMVSAQLTNPFNSMSTLMDYVGVNPKTGKAWDISFDPKDKTNPDVIYCEKDGQGWFKPILNTDQETLVKDYIKTKYIGMLNREVKKQSIGEVSQKTAAQAEYTKEQQKSAEIGYWMGILVSGSDADKIKAASFFNNQRNADGSYVFDEVTLDDNGKLNFKTKDKVIEYDISGNNKQKSGMQVYSAFEHAYGGGLFRDVFKNEMMNAGGKDVVLPQKGTRVVARSADRKTTTNTSSNDMSKYNP